jgi:hypothetical protein
MPQFEVAGMKTCKTLIAMNERDMDGSIGYFAISLPLQPWPHLAGELHQFRHVGLV